MRTGANLFHSTELASKATFSPPLVQRTPWYSPVTYLFGGLAAMLELIAFALLILAYSYWKISSSTEKRDGGSEAKASPIFEMKFLVIMAGDVQPSFLATPKTCCFDECDRR